MINMSSGGASQAISLKRGWVEVRELERAYLIRGDRASPVSARPPAPGPFRAKARGLARRFGYLMAAPPSDQVVDVLVASIPGNNPHVSVSPEADVDAMSSLAATVGSHASDRSAEFLRWRVGNPDRTYRFVYWRDTHLRGYMIVGWSGEHPQRAMVIDHSCEDESVFAELLEAVARIPRGDIELMASTLPERDRNAAHRLGFQPDPEHAFSKRRFFLWPLAPNTEGAALRAAASSWRVDLIDTMQG